MNKKLTQLKIETLIVTISEILIVGIFLTLYLLNIWNMNAYVRTEHIVYVMFVIIFLNGVYIWRVISAVSRIRQQSDIKTADIIGTDVQEAYIFGKLGFVVCDNTGVVLWESELLSQRQINVVNMNIYDWCPKLKDFLDKDIGDTLTISQNGFEYSIKYLRSANMFIFKDISEYESLSKYSREQATCVGVITIDNYSDIAGNADDNNDVITRVNGAILDYAKSFNVLLRHYKSDAYFAICNYQSLEKMKSDGFSILDQVRKFGAHERITPTLSIGFAHDFPDVNKLNDMASNAIDIAMSRGGDQAVISKYGTELEFFGGKTEAVEKRNKVKVRVVADSLIGLIDRASEIIIMGHTDLDMDALGSCLGVKAICDSRNKTAHIIFESKLAERKTKAAVASLYNREQLSEITLSCKEALDRITPSTLLIVCDVSRPSITICPKAIELTEKIVCIDHHRRAEEFIENLVLNYVEPSASSACELVTELIRYSTSSSQIKMDQITATIMLSGIFLDTGFYKNNSVGLRTFEASMILKEFGADNSTADDLLKDEYEEYVMINKIISSMKTPYYGVVYCVSDEEDILDGSTLAKTANQCMQLKGINAVFVIGKTNSDEVKISARSDGTVNVQILCEKLGGGGHLTQAAVAFKGQTIKQIETTLLETLSDYLSDARSLNNNKLSKGE